MEKRDWGWQIERIQRLMDESGPEKDNSIVAFLNEYNLLETLTQAKQAETRFRELLELAPDAIVGVDRDGRIVMVNAQAETLFGYTREELLGQVVECLIPEQIKKDHIRHRTGYVHAPRTRPMGTGLDLLAQRKDGSTFPVEISLSPLDTEDGLIITSIIRDVSDRKRMEEQLRRYTVDLERLVNERTEELRKERDFSGQVIDQANSLIMVLSPEGTVLLFNRQCEQTIGYRSEEVIGSDCIATFLPEQAQEQGRLILTGIAEKRFPDVWESPVRTKNGTIRTVLWRSGMIQDEKKRPVSVILVGHDMTEQRRLQEQVLQSERLAVVGRMAAQVAHEIRNPLSSIGLNIELLAEEIEEHGWDDREEANELIGITLSEIGRLNNVLNDYLLFARMPQKEPRDTSINDLVEEMARFIRPEAHLASVRVNCRMEKELPDVRIDPSLIRQAMLNCVRNAIEAMHNGGTLTLSTCLHENQVELSITDTGPGILPDHQTKVFDPFYSTKDKGTGLGLPYVRQIVREHDGQVTLHSKLEAGTTVTIRLPVSEDAERSEG